MTDRLPLASRGQKIRTAVATLWATGFLLWFFGQDLPNTGFSRPLVWNAILDDCTTVLNPLDYSAATDADYKAGWSYFPERLPFVLTAGLLLTAAAGLGMIAARLTLGRLPLLWSEHSVLVLGTGLSLQSLWILICGLAGRLSPVWILAPGIAGLLGRLALLFVDRRAERNQDATLSPSTPDWGWKRMLPAEKSNRVTIVTFVVILAAFSLHIVLGGMTPPFDFDVREYHLQGPKEWFQAGHIFTLEHNVYTSFPFLSEVLSLGTMVLQDDWRDGAIAGKLALTAFPFLSAIAVFAIARRWLGQVPAWLAAVAFLSTPWAVRMSIIAYAEGAITFYLIASVMAAVLAANCSNPAVRERLIAATGFLSGSAMAAKYPGVLSVVIPVGLFLLYAVLRRPGAGRWPSVIRNAALFIAAVTIAVGPWLLKNAVATGNPVYPLAYRVFGGNDWSPAMQAKWKAAHSAHEHELTKIPQHLTDLAVKNDWQNGLLFALAVPAFVLVHQYSIVRLLWLHTLWMLVTWWGLTHRIDRFWVPLLPLVAVLCAAAWNISSGKAWQRFLVGAVIMCSVYNYGFSRLSPVGFHAGLIELQAARELPVRDDFKTLNRTLPQDARVLMVGEAEVFDATFDLVYNTVFDDSIFQQWTSADLDSDIPAAKQRLKSADQIRETLKAHGITHVYVNWSEVLRYRVSYGYTDYVFPDRFRQLQDAGILDAPVGLSVGQISRLSDDQHKELLSWQGVDTLRVQDDVWTTVQLYGVRP